MADDRRRFADRKGSTPPSKKGLEMITFLAWWTSAAIVAGLGLTAWFVKLNYRAH